MFVRVSEINQTVTMSEDAQAPVLLALAQQGDGDAFCELCRLNEARLLRQAMVLCGDASSAEDLAQDTLVAAWKVSAVTMANVGSLPGFARSSFISIEANSEKTTCGSPGDDAGWYLLCQENGLANLADEAAYPDEAMDLSEKRPRCASASKACQRNIAM